MDTLRIGIVGLGRLGRVHAENIACKIPGARLVAACTTRLETLEYARELGVTALYTDFNQMLSEAEMDAVAVISTSSEHCWQIEAALTPGSTSSRKSRWGWTWTSASRPRRLWSGTRS